VIKTHAQTPGNTTVENCENMQVHKTKPHASAAGSPVHTRNLIKKKRRKIKTGGLLQFFQEQTRFCILMRHK